MTNRTERDRARFIELFARQEKTSSIAAAVICVTIVASSATSWTRFVAVLGLHVFLFPLNILLNKLVVPRLGARAEYPRAVVNAVVYGSVYACVGWPVASWLWVPFVALTFDQFGGRHQFYVVAISWGIQAAFALPSGGSPEVIVAFGVLGFIALAMGNARMAIIGDMLVEAEREIELRERTEVELRQAQKLEAVGRLAAGVAHEINTPMQFVGDNLAFVAEGVDDMLAGAASEDDAEYLREHLPRAIAEASEGVRRVAAIVSSLKRFAHPVSDFSSVVDINAAIEATLVIARHEYKLVADVRTRFGDLPPVTCNAGELNQVFLNLVVNAAHAIEDVVAARGRGLIEIHTSVVGGQVAIAIRDTGGGVPESVRARIFEPFFTTKAAGRGTGQGLAIARSVMERHGGSLEFTTAQGVGTTFVIRLPSKAKSAILAAAA